MEFTHFNKTVLLERIIMIVLLEIENKDYELVLIKL